MRAPATGREPSSSRPRALRVLSESASHFWTTRPDCVVRRPAPLELARRGRAVDAGVAEGDVCSAGVVWTTAACSVRARTGRSGGGFDSVFDPPSAKIWSSLETPPFEEVGVPPSVIAMYCLP